MDIAITTITARFFNRRSGDRSLAGFTLIELMVTVAIIAILAAIAVPSYRQYVIRGHRAAAKAEMMNIANREQQFLLANRSYANKATFEANGYRLPPEVNAFYTWDLGPDFALGPEPSFLITLTPTGAQMSDGVLTLNSQGTKIPADKWQK